MGNGPLIDGLPIKSGNPSWHANLLAISRCFSFQTMEGDSINHVLLVEIEGPVWYTIYHHLPLVKGVNKPLYENQPMRKGHL